MDENNRFDNKNNDNEGIDAEIKIDDIETVETIQSLEDESNDDAISISIGFRDEQKEKNSSNLLKEIKDWFFAIISALLIVFIIKGFVFDFVIVDGRSMQTTLMNNDRLVLTKLGYTPKRSDIVVLDAHYKLRESYIDTKEQTIGDNFDWFDELKLRYFPWEQKKFGIEPRHYVKRVIALEGDVIDINNDTNEVFVNGEKINEPYLDNVKTYSGLEMNFPYTVEKGHAFVMGDNREDSRDSRFIMPGTVPYEAILGKATFRFWPLSSFGTIK